DITQHLHKLTPYDGRTLSGVVERTIVNGRKVYHNGVFAEQNFGKSLMKVA
ncbi:MAG: allantoinase, partial [Cellvibrionaceae bacterium]